MPSTQQSLFEVGCLHLTGILQQGSQAGGGHTGSHFGGQTGLHAGSHFGGQGGGHFGGHGAGHGFSHTGCSESQHRLSEQADEKTATKPIARIVAKIPNLFIVLYSLKQGLIKKLSERVCKLSGKLIPDELADSLMA